MTHRYVWRKDRRPELYGRRCCVVCRLAKGSVVVEWETGGCDVVSKRALRKVARKGER